MYDKGIILDIKDKYCLAMTEKGAVIRIHKKQGMRVGDQIYILPEDLYQEEKTNRTVPFPIARMRRSFVKAAACAAAAFLLIFVSVFMGQEKAYAMVSAVGTGDVELELDKEYRIIRVKSYGASQDENQLNGLVGKRLEEAQPLLGSMAGSEGVIVGYALIKQGNPDEEAALASHLEFVFSGEAAVYLKGDARDVKNAKAKTVSLGIYMAQKAAENGNRKPMDLLEYHQKFQEQKTHGDRPDSGDADDDDMKTDVTDSGDADDDDMKADASDSDDADDDDMKADAPDSDEKDDDDRDSDDARKDGPDGGDKKTDAGDKAKPVHIQPVRIPEDNKPESAGGTDEEQKEEADTDDSKVRSDSGSSGSNDEEDNSKDDKDSNEDDEDGGSENSDDDGDSEEED